MLFHGLVTIKLILFFWSDSTSPLYIKIIQLYPPFIFFVTGLNFTILYFFMALKGFTVIEFMNYKKSSEVSLSSKIERKNTG